MLSKVIGTSTVLTMSGTAQSVTATTFTGETPKVVRIATNSQPAYINFNTAATTSTGILIPANSAEHFKLDSKTITVSTGTSSSIPSYISTYAIVTAYVSVLQAGSAGLISITPVA
jgi:hypothetical protein